MRVLIRYELDCNTDLLPDYKKLCAQIAHVEDVIGHTDFTPETIFYQKRINWANNKENWNAWPLSLGPNVFSDVRINLFIDNDAGMKFARGDSERADLVLHVVSVWKDRGTDALKFHVDGNSATVTTRNQAIYGEFANEKFASMHDFTGSTLVLSETFDDSIGDMLHVLRPKEIVIANQQGVT